MKDFKHVSSYDAPLTPKELVKQARVVEAQLEPIFAEESSTLASRIKARLAAREARSIPTPWQVPVLVELASRATTQRDRCGFLQRAWSKLQ